MPTTSLGIERPFRKWVCAAVCAAMLLSAAPRRAGAASLIEYTVLLAILLVAVIDAQHVSDDQTAPVSDEALFTVLGQLETSVINAQTASDAGNRAREIAWIGRGSGAASAIVGFTGACADAACTDLRAQMQAAIGLLGHRRSVLLGASCGNGVIDSGEQCDNNASPTGCENTTELSFCNLDCVCEPVIIE